MFQKNQNIVQAMLNIYLEQNNGNSYTNLERLLSLSKRQQYYLYNNNQTLYLTPKEAKFVLYWYYLPPGLPLYALSCYLPISIQTIYSYIKNIKSKLNMKPEESLTTVLNKTLFFSYCA